MAGGKREDPVSKHLGDALRERPPDLAPWRGVGGHSRVSRRWVHIVSAGR